MRILMFGWEFPPYNSGGLGVACEGLAFALAGQGVGLTFVLPKKVDIHSDAFDIVWAQKEPCLKLARVNSLLSPYLTSGDYRALRQGNVFYGRSIFEEVLRYAELARNIARQQECDVIHAHDWLSLKAGLAAKEETGRPLIFHVHATEFDRTGGRGINQEVYEIEKEGVRKADAVIAVSHFTKDILTRHYGANENKVQVVHNGINASEYKRLPLDQSLKQLKRVGHKLVLFVGRLTLQKGPDYFLEAAKRVSEYLPQTIFIIAGSGDMKQQMIEQAARLRIADNVIFAGFLRDKELTSVYQACDVLVMPSVSEPFGITALESLANATPVIISKQSGVSEVLSHALKVDFWDIDEMVNKIVAVLHSPSLRRSLQKNGKKEAVQFTWNDAAAKCISIYQHLLEYELTLSTV